MVTEKSTVSQTRLWAWRLGRDSESQGETGPLWRRGQGRGRKVSISRIQQDKGILKGKSKCLRGNVTKFLLCEVRWILLPSPQAIVCKLFISRKEGKEGERRSLESDREAGLDTRCMERRRFRTTQLPTSSKSP